MNKIYKNILRYGQIFIIIVLIEHFSHVGCGLGFILALVFIGGFILSQAIKDIENYLNRT